eukprot:TRINITY_DN42796_c0_g1_i2.p1 TRINITY_DN42796_c0_g1~~TRINITY_DN42796_c0_g1_i2.p1  ORF type:complete len:525 (-),score=101.81 TRINITY_DN42796_c0_g1_i2:66-1541(-)
MAVPRLHENRKLAASGGESSASDTSAAHSGVSANLQPESEPRSPKGSTALALDLQPELQDGLEHQSLSKRSLDNSPRSQGGALLRRNSTEEICSRVKRYTQSCNFEELFEFADKGSLDAKVRDGYMECANCKSTLYETAQLDGRCEVKVLPCFHSICGVCLHDMLATSHGDAVSCPICQRNCKKMLHRSFLPHFDVHSTWDSERGAQLTLMCEECLTSDVAESFCDSCVLSLCATCARQHKRAKATARHTLRKLKTEHEDEVSVQTRRAIYCAYHTSMPSRLYCEDCQSLICYQCAVESHQSHSYKLPSSTLVEKTRREIQQILDRLGGCLFEAQTQQRQLHTALADLEEAASEIKSQVNAAFNDLGSSVEARKQSLLKPLLEDGQGWREKMLAKRSECSRALVDLWRIIDFLEKICSRSTDIELLQVRGHMLNDRYQLQQIERWKMLAAEESECSQRPSVIAGWASAAERDDILKGVRSIGTVSTTDAYA